MEQPILFMLPNANEQGGFGFGQGSTDGVINRYQYRGFHRPGAREANAKARNSMNLRHSKGPYKCHFDPEYDVRLQSDPMLYVYEEESKPKEQSYLLVGLLTAGVLVFAATI